MGCWILDRNIKRKRLYGYTEYSKRVRLNELISEQKMPYIKQKRLV
jgi:hypothetical protein